MKGDEREVRTEMTSRGQGRPCRQESESLLVSKLKATKRQRSAITRSGQTEKACKVPVCVITACPDLVKKAQSTCEISWAHAKADHCYASASSGYPYSEKLPQAASAPLLLHVRRASHARRVPLRQGLLSVSNNADRTELRSGHQATDQIQLRLPEARSATKRKRLRKWRYDVCSFSLSHVLRHCPRKARYSVR
jgi:hypothetical protein